MLVKSIKLKILYILYYRLVYIFSVHVLKEDKVYQHIVLKSNLMVTDMSGTVIVNESLIQCSRTR